MPALKWKKPRTTFTVDSRSVVNPTQARTLLDGFVSIASVGDSSPSTAACTTRLCAPRKWPACTDIASTFRRRDRGNCTLTARSLTPDGSGPTPERTGTVVSLSSGPWGSPRTVPCPPELTALLNAHLDEFGTSSDGHVFVGERNHREMPRGTVNRVWREVRREVFTPAVVASPLAATPYDLRHAAVSTWLNGGIPPTVVAEWAGQSVEVLFRIYAKCLHGGAEHLKHLWQAALGHGAPSKTSERIRNEQP